MNMGVTRRMRLDAPVSTLIDAFRDARKSAAMRDALAQIAMRLVGTQDREQFQRADGATTIRTQDLYMLITCARVRWPAGSAPDARVCCSGPLGSNLGGAGDNGARLADVSSYVWCSVRTHIQSLESLFLCGT